MFYARSTSIEKDKDFSAIRWSECLRNRHRAKSGNNLDVSEFLAVISKRRCQESSPKRRRTIRRLLHWRNPRQTTSQSRRVRLRRKRHPRKSWARRQLPSQKRMLRQRTSALSPMADSLHGFKFLAGLCCFSIPGMFKATMRHEIPILLTRIRGILNTFGGKSHLPGHHSALQRSDREGH